MTTTTIISQLAADIVTRTIEAAEAEAKARDAVADAIKRSWYVAGYTGGLIGAELPLVCERFGCTEAEWFTDHDRFSTARDELNGATVRDALSNAVDALWSAHIASL